MGACKQGYILHPPLLNLKPLSCMEENVFAQYKFTFIQNKKQANAIPFSPLLNFCKTKNAIECLEESVIVQSGGKLRNLYSLCSYHMHLSDLQPKVSALWLQMCYVFCNTIAVNGSGMLDSMCTGNLKDQAWKFSSIDKMGINQLHFMCTLCLFSFSHGRSLNNILTIYK